MAMSRKSRGNVADGPRAALRQRGGFDWHPAECQCRKCRRYRLSLGKRSARRLPG
jgi:hypothetical protein